MLLSIIRRNSESRIIVSLKTLGDWNGTGMWLNSLPCSFIKLDATLAMQWKPPQMLWREKNICRHPVT